MDADGGGMATDALDPAPDPDPDPPVDPPAALLAWLSVGILPELELPAVMGEPDDGRTTGDRGCAEGRELEPECVVCVLVVEVGAVV